MKINIVAGGPFERIPALFRNNQVDELWMAVDRGLEYLRIFSIKPDFVIGDFDSTKVKPGEIESNSNCFIYPPEKDFTDLDLAITKAIELSPASIQIYGATGGRLDHEMVNLQLLLKILE
ncbi:MAG: thiamine diphosphokinase [Bacillaceae bacterium]|nr:thiamine diphosphokinase [Bacillaceae bacterium]